MSPRKRVATNMEHGGPVTKSPRKCVTTRTLSESVTVNSQDPFEIMKMESELFMKKSWVEICEEERAAENCNLVRDEEASNESITITSSRSRKQVAPQKTTVTTPRYMRSRVQKEKGLEVSRKRRMDSSRSSSVMSDYDGSSSIPRKRSSPRKKACSTANTPSRSRKVSDTEGTSSTIEIKTKDGWVEPKLGWCKDPEILIRRTKEIEKAKEKPVYTEYLQAISKSERVKGIHPRTPNKFINYSRRSWDSQIKLWKRSLYEFFGRTPDTSCRTTPQTSRGASPSSSIGEGINLIGEVIPKIGNVEVPTGVADPERMFSLLSKFDIDSRQRFREIEEESTLKATVVNAKGPTDFSDAL
uniref:Histone RNA hairpin-binding protein (inferred by orthology to a C. elegans protein) n=1 Tax=Strongyloides venezuelensis TaxID=75913 RepID=A0A0K0FN39_STRVS